MGLLDLLRNRKNATFDWVVRPGTELAVDLDRSSFCGVPVGGKLRDLSGLGPADDPRAQSFVLNWRRRGFYLVAADREQTRFEGFVLLLRPGPDAFAGRWRWRGQDLRITADATPDFIRKHIGEPFHEFREPPRPQLDEVVWFYETPQAEWQFGWENRLLVSVEISVFRELADPGSRQSYGCTKSPPWQSAS